MDAMIAALVADGFAHVDALGGVLTVIHYTLGATLEEQSDPRDGDPAVQLDAALPMLTVLQCMMEAHTESTRRDALRLARLGAVGSAKPKAKSRRIYFHISSTFTKPSLLSPASLISGHRIARHSDR